MCRFLMFLSNSNIFWILPKRLDYVLFRLAIVSQSMIIRI